MRDDKVVRMFFTLFGNFFQIKGFKIWEMTKWSVCFFTLFGHFFQKKSLKLGRWQSGPYVFYTFWTIFANPPIHKLIPPHICSRYARTNVARIGASPRSSLGLHSKKNASRLRKNVERQKAIKFAFSRDWGWCFDCYSSIAAFWKPEFCSAAPLFLVTFRLDYASFLDGNGSRRQAEARGWGCYGGQKGKEVKLKDQLTLSFFAQPSHGEKEHREDWGRM